MASKILRSILTTEDMDRISKMDNTSVQVDVHGMNKMECRHILRTIAAAYSGRVRITVIHGFNHGTTLRDSLYDQKEKVIKSSFRLIPSKKNPGVTIMEVAC